MFVSIVLPHTQGLVKHYLRLIMNRLNKHVKIKHIAMHVVKVFFFCVKRYCIYLTFMEGVTRVSALEQSQQELCKGKVIRTDEFSFSKSR